MEKHTVKVMGFPLFSMGTAPGKLLKSMEGNFWINKRYQCTCVQDVALAPAASCSERPARRFCQLPPGNSVSDDNLVTEHCIPQAAARRNTQGPKLRACCRTDAWEASSHLHLSARGGCSERRAGIALQATSWVGGTGYPQLLHCQRRESGPPDE